MNSVRYILVLSILLVVGCGHNGESHSEPVASDKAGAENVAPSELIKAGVPKMLQIYEDSGTVKFTPECREVFEALLQAHGGADSDEITRFGERLRSEVVRRGIASEEEAYLIPNDYESYVIFRGNGFRSDE